MAVLRRVACLMSGSTDSAVAALLLKTKGYDVTGVFLKNKYEDRTEAQHKAERAELAAHHLNLPFVTMDIHDIHWQYFLQIVANQFKKNQVPNADMLFSQHILFGRLFEQLITVQGMDAVASGHYARTSLGDEIFSPSNHNHGNRLLRAMDLQWDQTFLLSQLVQHTLRQTLFPLGDMNRDIVAKVAEATELKVLDAKMPAKITSRGSYVNQDLLLKDVQSMFPSVPGQLQLLESGRSVGRHEGLHLHQVGDSVQIDNTTFYVASKDVSSGKIILVESADHPALYCSSGFISLAHWNHQTPYDFFEKQMMDAEYKLNSPRSDTVKCVLTVGMNNEYCGNDHLILSSSRPIWGVGAGKHCAIYKGEECMGGATVLKPGASEYAMNYHKYRKDQTKESLFAMFRRKLSFDS